MGTAADSVFVFQKSHFFFCAVRLCEVGIDTAFAALHIPAACQSGVNFIFGDEHSQSGNLGHIRLVFASRQSQISKLFANNGDFVIVEAHEVTIFAVGGKEVCIFVSDFLQEIGVFQSFGKSRRCIGKAASVVVVE